MIASGPGAIKEPAYSSSRAFFFTHTDTELADTLMATDYKDPQIVCSKEDEKQKGNYTIRKLTPKECARLQGFPDWWCDDLGIKEKDITDEELDFWENVWETYRLATNNSNKKKSRNQIKKWLINPNSDSAEYKMWGNGVALPCVYFVLSGIVYYSQQSEEKSSRKTRYKNIFG